MINIFYLIGAIVYGVFIIRFILSLFIDSISYETEDIISLSGLLHFLMGFSAWMCSIVYINASIIWLDYVMAVGLGTIFTLGFLFIYYIRTKLYHFNTNADK